MPKKKDDHERQMIVATIAELQQRLSLVDKRQQLRDKLREFVQGHPELLRVDVLRVAREMQAKGFRRPGGKDFRRGPDAATREKMGLAIKAARQAKGLTPEDVATKIGANNRSYIHKWERGSVPGPTMRPKLAKVLGLDFAKLLGAGKANGAAAH